MNERLVRLQLRNGWYDNDYDSSILFMVTNMSKDEILIKVYEENVKRIKNGGVDVVVDDLEENFDNIVPDMFENIGFAKQEVFIDPVDISTMENIEIHAGEMFYPGCGGWDEYKKRSDLFEARTVGSPAVTVFKLK